MMILPAIALILSAQQLGQLPQAQVEILPATELDPPPAAVADLAASDPTETTIKLTWMAPADTSPSITPEQLGPGIRPTGATAYDVRYSLVDPATVGSTWWDEATPSTDEDGKLPQLPGNTETLTVTGLASGFTYYFAIKSRDNVSASHWSQLSNIASNTTVALPIAAPPPPPIQGTVRSSDGGGCGASSAGQAAGALAAIGLVLVMSRR